MVGQSAVLFVSLLCLFCAHCALVCRLVDAQSTSTSYQKQSTGNVKFDSYANREKASGTTTTPITKPIGNNQEGTPVTEGDAEAQAVAEQTKGDSIATMRKALAALMKEAKSLKVTANNS